MKRSKITVPTIINVRNVEGRNLQNVKAQYGLKVRHRFLYQGVNLGDDIRELLQWFTFDVHTFTAGMSVVFFLPFTCISDVLHS